MLVISSTKKMEIICSLKEFKNKINQYCNIRNDSSDSISTGYFDINYLKLMIDYLNKHSLKISSSKLSDWEESLKYIISSFCLSLWLNDLNINYNKLISISFFWDCDELAFDIYDINKNKLFAYPSPSIFSTSWLSKRTIINMIKFLYNNQQYIYIESCELCHKNYITKESRKAILNFIDGNDEMPSPIDEDDSKVIKYYPPIKG